MRSNGKLILFSIIIWTISGLAFTSSEPELDSLLGIKKNSPDYKLLKQIQELTLDLQLLELAIKNKQDSTTEKKLAEVFRVINKNAESLSRQLQALKATQLEAIYLQLRRLEKFIPTDSLFEDIKQDKIKDGIIEVTVDEEKLSLFQLSRVEFRNIKIWNFEITNTGKTFWSRFKTKETVDIKNQIEFQNHIYKLAVTKISNEVKIIRDLFFDAHENVRFSIFNRIQQLRSSLIDLAKSSTSMDTAEQLSTLYNQILDGFYMYGINTDQFGFKQDLKVSGFLLAKSTAETTLLIEKLKLRPTY